MQNIIMTIVNKTNSHTIMRDHVELLLELGGFFNIPSCVRRLVDTYFLEKDVFEVFCSENAVPFSSRPIFFC